MANISIVIVDDEVLVRQGIKSYIESAGEDMEIAGTFSNAKEAIEFLKNNSVHILITDIKMAQMSGVDLIRHCVRCLYPMGIIVLSCYNDFEYAREAFALGASAYILKDEVTQPQLISEIKRIYVRLKSMICNQSETGNFSIQDVLQYPEHPCIVAKINFRTRYEQFSPLKMNADSKIVFDVASEIVRSNSIGRLLNHGGEMMLCIEPEDVHDTKSITEKVALAAKQLYTNLLNYFNERIYLSVSDLSAGQEFRDAANQAARVADLAFYDEESTLFFFSDLLGTKPEPNVSFYTCQIELSSKEWYACFQSDLDAYFAWARQKILPPKKLIKNMQGFLYKLEDHLQAYYNTAFTDLCLRPGAIDRDILDNMDHCEAVRDYVLFITNNAIRYIGGLKAADAAFNRIVEYIDNHYATPVTLAVLAESFHINSSYLCKLFKEKMNISFVSYLNQVRIDHVKQLLKNPRFSLEEIAEKTGFNNANYLVRVFKRMTGLTVGEYRRK